MSADPRSRAQRRRDTEHRLTHDKDAWVASASADGAPHLVPLSFDWDGEALLVATPYRWFRISPRRIQAWREVNELPDRETSCPTGS